MGIKEWNTREFLSLYHNIEEQSFQYCIWVPPYMCQNNKCAFLLGFICDDEFKNTDSDLHLKFQNCISSWSTMIYDALNHDKVLPQAGKDILQSCEGCGYKFL